MVQEAPPARDLKSMVCGSVQTSRKQSKSVRSSSPSQGCLTAHTNSGQHNLHSSSPQRRARATTSERAPKERNQGFPPILAFASKQLQQQELSMLSIQTGLRDTGFQAIATTRALNPNGFFRQFQANFKQLQQTRALNIPNRAIRHSQAIATTRTRALNPNEIVRNGIVPKLASSSPAPSRPLHCTGSNLTTSTHSPQITTSGPWADATMNNASQKPAGQYAAVSSGIRHQRVNIPTVFRNA